jgi:hypothetical protein
MAARGGGVSADNMPHSITSKRCVVEARLRCICKGLGLGRKSERFLPYQREKRLISLDSCCAYCTPLILFCAKLIIKTSRLPANVNKENVFSARQPGSVPPSVRHIRPPSKRGSGSRHQPAEVMALLQAPSEERVTSE